MMSDQARIYPHSFRKDLNALAISRAKTKDSMKAIDSTISKKLLTMNVKIRTAKIRVEAAAMSRFMMRLVLSLSIYFSMLKR